MNPKVFLLLVIVSHTQLAKSAINSIDLKSILNGNKVIYNNGPISTKINKTRLYSSQIDIQTISKLFTIHDKKEIVLKQSITRLDICKSVKYCNAQESLNKKCTLGLSLIFYSSETRYFDHIKPVQLNILINDFTTDHLKFQKNEYQFDLSSDAMLKSNSNMLSLGHIRAEMTINTDFNNAVEYYLDFSPEDKSELTSLFQIQPENGNLLINKSLFLRNRNNFNREFVFYVDAISQCANENPLRNRSTVRVNVTNLNESSLHVTDLVETKSLTKSYECVKLTMKDLANREKIALSQVNIRKICDFYEIIKKLII